MTRLAYMALAFTILFTAAAVHAEPRNPAIAALPEATPALRHATPASTGDVEGISRADALARLQREGFKTVTRLVRDSEGNWIGAARRGSRVVDIAVDQDGDVIAW